MLKNLMKSKKNTLTPSLFWLIVLGFNVYTLFGERLTMSNGKFIAVLIGTIISTGFVVLGVFIYFLNKRKQTET
ncbi:MAG: hypothetical protein Sapg2KO_14990 [Saprospiraceae bacterium]